MFFSANMVINNNLVAEDDLVGDIAAAHLVVWILLITSRQENQEILLPYPLVANTACCNLRHRLLRYKLRMTQTESDNLRVGRRFLCSSLTMS